MLLIRSKPVWEDSEYIRWANGIPRKLSTPSAAEPMKVPLSRVTVGATVLSMTGVVGNAAVEPLHRKMTAPTRTESVTILQRGVKAGWGRELRR